MATLHLRTEDDHTDLVEWITREGRETDAPGLALAGAWLIALKPEDYPASIEVPSQFVAAIEDCVDDWALTCDAFDEECPTWLDVCDAIPCPVCGCRDLIRVNGVHVGCHAAPNPERQP